MVTAGEKVTIVKRNSHFPTRAWDKFYVSITGIIEFLSTDTSVATESWDGLNSLLMGKYRYKLFIKISMRGYLIYW